MLEQRRESKRRPVMGDEYPGKGAHSLDELAERYVTGRERREIIARVREDAGTPSTWSPGGPEAA